MRRKLLTIILSLAMLAAMIPTTAFAATIHPGESKEQSVPKVEKYHGKYIIRDVTSTLEMYKQALYDALDEEYAGAVKDKSEYSSEVWKRINEVYDAEVKHIEETDNADDLLQIVWIFMLPNDETVKALMTIDCLAAMTKNVINAKTDYAEKRADLKTKCEAQFNDDYYKADYNDYYWSCIQGDYDKCIKSINKVKNLDTYIDALVFAAMTDLYDPGLVPDEDDDDDWDDDDWDDDDDDWGDEEETLLGVKNFFMPFSDGYFTNSEIASLKKNLDNYLDAYVDTQLIISEYEGDIAPLRKSVNAAKQKYAKMYDAVEITGVFYRTLNKMIETTGIEMQGIDYCYDQIIKELEDLQATYKKENYSDAKWSELEMDFMMMEFEIDSVSYRAALPVDITAAAKAVIDKIPTYKQELKALKNEYKSKLDKYVGNVKYNQTKLKPIVAEGKKAITASSDLMEVEALYYSYNQRAKATIKKFKITTVKVGKGTITKTQKVKYGNTFTVKITPKAGYKISMVYIDGKKKKLKNSYTFKNVKKAHKVKVVFKK